MASLPHSHEDSITVAECLHPSAGAQAAISLQMVQLEAYQTRQAPDTTSTVFSATRPAFCCRQVPTWATNNLWPETDGMSSGLKSFVDSVIIILSTGYTIGCLSAIGCGFRFHTLTHRFQVDFPSTPCSQLIVRDSCKVRSTDVSTAGSSCRLCRLLPCAAQMRIRICPAHAHATTVLVVAVRCAQARHMLPCRLHLLLPLDDGGDDKFVKPIAQDPTKHGTDAVRPRARVCRWLGPQSGHVITSTAQLPAILVYPRTPRLHGGFCVAYATVMLQF